MWGGVVVTPIIGYAGRVASTVQVQVATNRARSSKWLGDVTFTIWALDWVGKVDVCRA